jgi:hypothetical protein
VVGAVVGIILGNGMSARRGFTHRKRRAAAPEEPAWDEGIELDDLREQVTALDAQLHAAAPRLLQPRRHR